MKIDSNNLVLVKIAYTCFCRMVQLLKYLGLIIVCNFNKANKSDPHYTFYNVVKNIDYFVKMQTIHRIQVIYVSLTESLVSK